MTRVLVTGGSGFVGGALVARLRNEGVAVTVATRRAPEDLDLPDDVRCVTVATMDGDTDWRAAMDGVDAVVHLAARVHVMRETEAEPLAAFRRANVDATRSLAEQVAAAGIGRLVYLSSIKANGERTPGAAFREDNLPAPRDPYGISKWEAEQALAAVGDGLRYVVLRPPLVYGPHVKGNFLSLIRAVDAGWPLPLGLVRARRSLISVTNLVDSIAFALRNDSALGETFLVSDGEPVTVRGLIEEIAAALDRPARLLPVPLALLRFGAALTARQEVVGRLLDTLAVDDRKIRDALGWRPPETLGQGLAATVRQYREDRQRVDVMRVRQ